MDILWDNPKALFGLWLLVPVGALLVHAHRRRLRAATRFADPKMEKRLMPPLRNSRIWMRGILTLIGVACFIVALARPRWGVYFETVSQKGVDVLVLLDVSRSMLSQ